MGLPKSRDVRVFTGRTSMGVRGITLADKDRLISLTILRHMDADSEERAAYLRRANAVRRGGVEERALRRRARVVMGWIEAPEEPEPEAEIEVEGEHELTAEEVFAPSEEPVAAAEAVGEAQDS
eukprot:gene39757-53755_t